MLFSIYKNRLIPLKKKKKNKKKEEEEEEEEEENETHMSYDKL
jgi:hypothetical protein